MADQPAQADTQAETAGGSQAEHSEDADPQAGEAQRTVSWEKHQKVVSAERNLRERLKKYEQAEEAALPELERTQKELKKLQAERDALHLEIRQSRLTSAAVKAGALYPDAVARLVPDDAEDYEKAVREVQKAYPALFPKGTVDGGAGQQNGQAAQLSMNDLIRQRMGRN